MEIEISSPAITEQEQKATEPVKPSPSTTVAHTKTPPTAIIGYNSSEEKTSMSVVCSTSQPSASSPTIQQLNEAEWVDKTSDAIKTCEQCLE